MDVVEIMNSKPARATIGLLAVAAIVGAGVSLWKQMKAYGFLNGEGQEEAMMGTPGMPGMVGGRPPSAEEVVAVLPRDGIPAIFTPRFVSAGKAWIADAEYVIGYAHAGEAHAYPVGMLDGREIVNDVVGGQKIAVTW
jgi:hypothetical protein